MSELQKWITSISGAAVCQIVVLGFFYLMVSKTASPNLSAKSGAPKEVTIMLSQMVEQFREPLPETQEVKLEPEEELPKVETVPSTKQFVNTDSNTAQVEAPKNALFESDRNTKASTEFLPDPNQPQVVGPTLRGEEKIKSLSLADQEYVPGEIGPTPSPPPLPAAMNQAAAASSVPISPSQLSQESQDTAPSESKEQALNQGEAEKKSEGEATESKPGQADMPPDKVAEVETQPDAQTIGDTAQLAMTTKSFVNPESGSHAIKESPIGDKEQEAASTKKTEENGEPVAPEEKKEIRATPVVSGQSVDNMKQQADVEVRKLMDDSMFSAHHRKNRQNGSITALGEGSVDAEATEIGKYKRSVEQAISKKWHQYRVDRAQDVTWGSLTVRFNVTPSGGLTNLRVTRNEATTLVTEFSLRAIVDAKIPPMPREVADVLGSSGFEMHYNIIIY